MKNCLVCGKELTGAVKSAKADNGDFYLMCNSCGNVHAVKTDSNGLTTIERTRNGNDPETLSQMMEAARLFRAAGVSVTGFKSDIHSEKEDASKLDENPEKEVFLEKIRALGMTKEKTGMTEDQLWEDYKKFLEKHDNDPASMLRDLLKKALISSLGLPTDLEEDECCDCCDCCDCDDEEDIEDECDCSTCEDRYECSAYNEDEDDFSMLDHLSSERFIAIIKYEDGSTDEVTASDEEDIANMLAEFETRGIEVQKLYEVKLVERKITHKVTSKYTIE